MSEQYASFSSSAGPPPTPAFGVFLLVFLVCDSMMMKMGVRMGCQFVPTTVTLIQTPGQLDGGSIYLKRLNSLLRSLLFSLPCVFFLFCGRSKPSYLRQQLAMPLCHTFLSYHFYPNKLQNSKLNSLMLEDLLVSTRFSPSLWSAHCTPGVNSALYSHFSYISLLVYNVPTPSPSLSLFPSTA